jgi:L-arabinokinase
VIISAGDVRRLLAGDYQAARRWFRQGDGIAWAAYVAGVVLVLAAECGADGQRGLRLLVRSAVPEGKGVSSSAALEVAAFQAARLGQNIQVSGTEAARLCQLAENLVVGAPCGIMDQMTSALGQASQLLALLCQPAEVQGFVEVPDSIRVWGIDSGIRHAVSGSDYGSVRTGAFMGYRMIAEQAGWRASPTAEDGVVHIEDPQCRGYLANLLPEDFASLFAGHLPETIRGDDFLRHYGGTTDRVTRVDPHRAYAVRQPAAHPVYEHARVAAFRRLLTSELNDTVLVEMGEMMYASHASYSACGLGSAGTDRLVEKVRQAGTASGMFGAKITGGGSGGTVAVLGRADAAERVFQVAEEYGRETDRRAYVFSGSSPGAYAFGVHCVEAW